MIYLLIIIMRFAFVIASIAALRIDTRAKCSTNGDCTSPEVCNSGSCGSPDGGLAKAKCNTGDSCGTNGTCNTAGECVEGLAKKKAKCATGSACTKADGSSGSCDANEDCV